MAFFGNIFHRKRSFRKQRNRQSRSVTSPQVIQEIPASGSGSSSSPNDLSFVSCSKYQGHEEFVPINSFSSQHLPDGFTKRQDWAKIIQLRGNETVRLRVKHTSSNRPNTLGFREFIGTSHARFGSGTVFQADMKNKELCSRGCQEVKGEHFVSGLFKVVTAAHVVFDDEEARNTTIDFFYDDEDEPASIVKGTGVRVCEVDVEGNRSVIECRTHDLHLWDRLENCRKERDQYFQEISTSGYQTNGGDMVLIISHPHGKAKHVSIGELLEITENGGVRTLSDGLMLIGCNLTYTTPTCYGSGGGSVSLIQYGKFTAFAPHCSARHTGENVSGLGWMKAELMDPS